jgi:CRISPR-associated protein Csm2
MSFGRSDGPRAGGVGQRFLSRQGGAASGQREDLQRRLRDTATVDYFVAGANRERPAPRAALFDADAEGVARKLAGIPASQLRRFFGGVMAIKRRLEIDSGLGAEFVRGEMALLKARAAYTLARLKYDSDGEKDPGELLSLFVRHGRSVDDRASFMAFARHLEAVTAFHKVFEVKGRERD